MRLAVLITALAPLQASAQAVRLSPEAANAPLSGALILSNDGAGLFQLNEPSPLAEPGTPIISIEAAQIRPQPMDSPIQVQTEAPIQAALRQEGPERERKLREIFDGISPKPAEADGQTPEQVPEIWVQVHDWLREREKATYIKGPSKIQDWRRSLIEMLHQEPSLPLGQAFARAFINTYAADPNYLESVGRYIEKAITAKNKSTPLDWWRETGEIIDDEGQQRRVSGYLGPNSAYTDAGLFMRDEMMSWHRVALAGKRVYSVESILETWYAATDKGLFKNSVDFSNSDKWIAATERDNPVYRVFNYQDRLVLAKDDGLWIQGRKKEEWMRIFQSRRFFNVTVQRRLTVSTPSMMPYVLYIAQDGNLWRWAPEESTTQPWREILKDAGTFVDLYTDAFGDIHAVAEKGNIRSDFAEKEPRGWSPYSWDLKEWKSPLMRAIGAAIESRQGAVEVMPWTNGSFSGDDRHIFRQDGRVIFSGLQNGK